jgi:ATP-binding cassette subfamily F protein 3
MLTVYNTIRGSLRYHFNGLAHKSTAARMTTISSSSFINIEGLSLSFGDKVLFDNLNLQVSEGEKLFVVGDNGVGKTTLLRIIGRKLLEYDGKCRTNGKVGYLPQSFEMFPDRTALEHLILESQHPDLIELLNIKKSLNYDGWEDDFTAYGGYQFMSIFHKLKLPSFNLNRRFQSLSGGEKVKIHLATLSILQPHILLLDEPTNHLDDKGLCWLEEFLKRYAGALVTVTHDRSLINNTANRISELSSTLHRLVHFKGGYQSYLSQQEKIQERLKQERLRQENEINQLTKKLVGTIHESSTKIKRASKDRDQISFNAGGERQQKSQKRIANQISNKIETLEHSLIDVPADRKEIKVSFSSMELTHEVSIRLENVSKSFEDLLLLSSANFMLKRGERVILLGENGTGKSTFLKILSGKLKPNSGVVTISPGVIIGFLDQEQETLDLSKSPFDLLCEGSHSNDKRHEVINHLNKFGVIYSHDLYSPLENLSIGCRRKVQLALMTLKGANVLLLDEPTNHIDFVSLEKIEEELLKFTGAILAISHDRYFIKKTATRVINISEFKLNNEMNNNDKKNGGKSLSMRK